MSDERGTSSATPCPHCGQPLGLNIVAKLKEESKLCFRLEPAPGEVFSAKNIGRAIESMSDILKACAREQKVPVEVLIERIDTADTGEISVHMLVARGHEHRNSRRNRKARFAAREPQP